MDFLAKDRQKCIPFLLLFSILCCYLYSRNISLSSTTYPPISGQCCSSFLKCHVSPRNCLNWWWFVWLNLSPLSSRLQEKTSMKDNNPDCCTLKNSCSKNMTFRCYSSTNWSKWLFNWFLWWVKPMKLQSTNIPDITSYFLHKSLSIRTMQEFYEPVCTLPRIMGSLQEFALVLWQCTCLCCQSLVHKWWEIRPIDNCQLCDPVTLWPAHYNDFAMLQGPE